MTLFQHYPYGFWFTASTGEIVDSLHIWADGQGGYFLGELVVVKVQPWELQ